MAACSRDDQIGSFLVRNFRDHMRRASCHHVRQLELRLETFLLQVLDLLPDRGLDLVLVDFDRICAAPTGTADLSKRGREPRRRCRACRSAQGWEL